MVDVKEKVLPMLKCALKTNTNNHICEEPILLSCGHCICKRCLEAGVSHTSIECNTCKKMNERDLSVKQEPTMFNFILNDYIQPVFSMIRDEFNKHFKQYQDILENNDEIIDLRIEFVRDQIQIRIESLKNELDNLNDGFNKRLDEMKVQFKQYFNESDLKSKINENKFENQLHEMNKLLSNNQNLTQNLLYDYQNELFKLKNTIKEIENEYPKVSFNVSKEVLGNNVVGNLVSTLDCNIKCYDELNKRIKEGKCEIFKLNDKIEPFDMCSLSNGNLLVANRGLTLFDKSMNALNSFTSLHGLNNILGATTNGADEIYLTDYSYNSILKTNLSFDKLALYVGDQLKGLCGICYYNGFIFVCEFGNKSVHKLDTNLALQNTYRLNFTPWYIKNCKNIGCVRNSGFDIFFYDLNTFTEISRYNGEAGLIGTICDRFYSFSFGNTKMLRCYDESGKFISEIKLNNENVKGNSSWGALCFYNSKLFICKRDVSNLIAI